MNNLKAAARILSAILMAGVALAGCGRGRSAFPPTQSVIYVSSDGGIYTSLTGTYDEKNDYYSQEELQRRVEKEVADYNAGGAGAGEAAPVTVTEVDLKNGEARVILQYRNGEELCRFTESSQDVLNHPETLEVTTASVENVNTVSWFTADKNEAADSEEILKRGDLNLVKVSGSVTVQTESRILYYSGSVNLQDEFTAQITDGEVQLIFQ